MKEVKCVWIIGLIIALLIVTVPIVAFISTDKELSGDPWRQVPVREPHVDHGDLLKVPFETGSDVTRACLFCHEDAAHEVTQTVHSTWESPPVLLEGRDEPVTIGKKNSINNFCIGIQGNWTGCTRSQARFSNQLAGNHICVAL